MDLITDTLSQTLTAEDEMLLVEAARQNPEAFDALYCRYLAPVYRYLYSRVQNRADAEDLTAQVFIEALEALNRYRDQGTFAAWLFTIARRRAIDHHRRKRPVFTLDENHDHPDGHDPLAQILENERLHQLTQHLQTLTDDEREMLRLRFAAELTFPEIGTVLKRRPEAVKMALHRLLRRLEAVMEQ